MQALFESGRIVDIALALIAAEAVTFIWLARRRAAGKSRSALSFIAALLPGVCLMMALRAALVDAGWVTVALWLTASLPAHLFDVYRRLRSG